MSAMVFFYLTDNSLMLFIHSM